MESDNKKVIARTNPDNAELGKGAPGNQIGVQTAQTTAVNPSDMVISSGADRELNKEQIHNLKSQEAETGVSTTDGYILDESGQLCCRTRNIYRKINRCATQITNKDRQNRVFICYRIY